ncbi:amine oxidase [Diaporthe amygdali]|uniref:amine oxidase n=1 Tax=Phomopsis amygdali TaxID=1214568 RepID=UPI0022FE334F|nr:amine oxidase [Diaporthe amygdali]KAJ0124554.1 amine oxidase [Diaporthe amygdali]
MSSLKNNLLWASGFLAFDCVAAKYVTRATVNADVIIIGGGAGGAHAAVQLSDAGQKVIVIEKQSDLGGSVDSYNDPATGVKSELGVAAWVDYGNTTGFFDRLDVPYASPDFSQTPWKYFDFTTGQTLTNYTSPSQEALSAAWFRYINATKLYENLHIPGYFNFPNGSDIPEELLMPFGDFVQKYDLAATLPSIFYISPGLGTVVDQLTLTVLQAFPASMAESYVGQRAGYVPASGRNQDIYDAAAALLGDKVYYSTEAISAIRSDDSVTVTVQNSITGQETVIAASKLLLAIPPHPSHFTTFDMDTKEVEVLSKLSYSRLWATAVQSDSFASDFYAFNLPASANDSSQLHYPSLNFTSTYIPFGNASKLVATVSAGDDRLDAMETRNLFNQDVAALSGTGAVRAADKDVEVIHCSDHGLIHGRATAEDIRNGFFQDLNALQGYRSTWYTGNTFAAPVQTIIWALNDQEVIPRILAA